MSGTSHTLSTSSYHQGGFRNKSLEFDAFHRERSIPFAESAAGTRQNNSTEQFHVRFCFPDAATAPMFVCPALD
jgi:hypothetical protein